MFFWVNLTTRLDPIESPALGSPSWRVSVGSLCLRLDHPGAAEHFLLHRQKHNFSFLWISHGTHKVYETIAGGYILNGTLWQCLCPSHAPAGMDTMHWGALSSSLHCTASSTIIFVVNLIMTKMCEMDPPREQNTTLMGQKGLPQTTSPHSNNLVE